MNDENIGLWLGELTNCRLTTVGPDTAGHLIGRSLQAAIRYRFRVSHESRSQVRRGFHATLRAA